MAENARQDGARKAIYLLYVRQRLRIVHCGASHTGIPHNLWAMLSHRIVVSAAFCVLSTLTLALGESLSDEAQVGQSFLGKLDQAYFPKWLGDSESACPWPEQDSAAAASIPQTNVTRRYHWTLSRGQLSPDGVLRDVILVNQQYPGPLVEANWGDWIEIQVENNITSPDEGASIHWHGSLQTKTPWADGVPGVSGFPHALYADYLTLRCRCHNAQSLQVVPTPTGSVLRCMVHRSGIPITPLSTLAGLLGPYRFTGPPSSITISISAL